MGKRVPEHIVKNMKTQKPASLFLPLETTNKEYSMPAGFKSKYYPSEYTIDFIVNISHPTIQPYYEAYKKCLRKPSTLDDIDRFIFEADMVLNVFRVEFLKSPHSNLYINKFTEISLKNKESIEKWVQYRTKLFGEKKEAG